MHHLWLIFPVLSAVLLADLARATPPAPLWGDIRVMHTWNTVPANWESLGPPPAGTGIDLYIALKPNHENALIDALYEVSDPMHKKYGAHLSREQVADLVAPHQDTLEVVHSWLEHHGVPASSISTSHGGGWLTITGMPVSQADELLSASYQLYRQTKKDETKVILRTVSYALPAVLHAHVQTVAPTTHFASPRTPLQTPLQRSSKKAAAIRNATSGELVRVLSKRGSHVTPPFLRWLYKTQAYVPSALDRNALGSLGFLDQCPSTIDLQHFMTYFRTDAEAADFFLAQVNGGVCDPHHPGVSPNLHVQYTGAIAYPTTHIFFSTGGDLKMQRVSGPIPGDSYLEWLKYLLALENAFLPQTISMSYVNYEIEVTQPYARALCELFAQLGLRGVSVLASSGDSGVGVGEECLDRFGKPKFAAMFPASCPYVTSVGGTTGFNPEVAATLSGGGFSRYFKRPPYQDKLITLYLSLLGIRTYRGLYRRNGRGIPDVAAQALRFAFIHDNILQETNGTHCSTTAVAGIVSLLNDYQISRGKAPLGFLNPWLYGLSLKDYEHFNDITSGSNPGCDTAGFSAVTGWDPVTGVGTLDFERLQGLLDS